MEISLSPEVEARLQSLAAQSGQRPEKILETLVLQKIDYDAWFRKEVEKGLASLDRGEYYTQEEIEARFAEQLKD